MEKDHKENKILYVVEKICIKCREIAMIEKFSTATNCHRMPKGTHALPVSVAVCYHKRICTALQVAATRLTDEISFY